MATLFTVGDVGEILFPGVDTYPYEHWLSKKSKLRGNMPTNTSPLRTFTNFMGYRHFSVTTNSRTSSESHPSNARLREWTFSPTE